MLEAYVSRLNVPICIGRRGQAKERLIVETDDFEQAANILTQQQQCVADAIHEATPPQALLVDQTSNDYIAITIDATSLHTIVSIAINPVADSTEEPVADSKGE